MTDTPQFAVKEFMSAAVFNTAAETVTSAMQQFAAAAFSPGLLAPGGISISTLGMIATVSFPAPVGAIFPNTDQIAYAHGTTNGADTQSYSVSLASLVPGTGSVTAYVYITPTTVQQNPYTVVGPPRGHPSYDPNFVPYTAYATVKDSWSMSAGTGVPSGSLQIFSTVLTAGQSSIGAVSIAGQTLAGAQVGVAPGTYQDVSIVIDSNGQMSLTSQVLGADQLTGPSSGTTTGSFVVPSGVSRLNAILVGPGGGGGGYDHTAVGGAGTGSGAVGGAGGGAVFALIPVSPGDVWNYSLPAGGAGGAAGSSGATGGSATFFNAANTLGMTATGGGGGLPQSGPSNPTPGIGELTGLPGYVLTGGYGITGTVLPVDIIASGYVGVGGFGGESAGGYGQGAQNAANTNGHTGIAPGGGGGGAGGNTTTSHSGGQGGAAGLMLWWGV